MNRTLIITGGSRGIGKAAIELFLQNEWRVINIARTVCELGDVTNLMLDLSDQKFSTQCHEQLLKILPESQQICLVHNAALYEKDKVDELDSAAFRAILEVNLVAPLALNRILVPMMQANSSIIYIGSTLSEKAVANNASYVISKHASVGMMRATTQDLANQQIHSCCICPGFTETDMLVKHLNDKPELKEILNARVVRIV